MTYFLFTAFVFQTVAKILHAFLPPVETGGYSQSTLPGCFHSFNIGLTARDLYPATFTGLPYETGCLPVFFRCFQMLDHERDFRETGDFLQEYRVIQDALAGNYFIELHLGRC